MKYDDNYLKKSRKVGKTMHKSAGIEQYSYPVGTPQKRRKKKTSGQPGSLFPEAGIPVDNFLYFSENLYPLIIGEYVILHTLCNIIR